MEGGGGRRGGRKQGAPQAAQRDLGWQSGCENIILKPQVHTGKGLRVGVAPKHREHVLTYLEEALLQKL